MEIYGQSEVGCAPSTSCGARRLNSERSSSSSIERYRSGADKAAKLTRPAGILEKHPKEQAETSSRAPEPSRRVCDRNHPPANRDKEIGKHAA
jgi:hypothetical protein